jgi:DNA-binding CsgD family transcriptional regulator
MTSGDLLEREGELGLLAEKIEAACRGAGGVVLVEGPPGVGKTRLLGEANEVALAARARVLVAKGSELEHEFAYGVVRQLFESELARAEPGERQAWLSGAAEPAEKVLGSVTSQAPAGDFATLHGLYWLAVNMAQEAPLVLLVDDLQWADVASQRFMTYIGHRLEALPIAVVASTRPQVRETDDTPLLQMMSADPMAVSMRLGPLSRAAAAVIVNRALGDQVLAHEKFIGACHDATGGNPLLLRQLMQVVTAEGIEPVAANEAKILQVGPKAVSRYVAVRLSELPPEHEHLARSMAVLGDGTQLQRVADHAGLAVATAAMAADELQRVNILAQPASEDPAEWITRTLSFVHPLIHATIYAGLDPTARIEGHVRAAEVLINAGADAQHVAAHLLHTLPGTIPNAAEILRRAAADALARGSPDSAHTYLRRCLQEPQIEDRVEALTQTASCARFVDLPAAVAPLREALALSANPAQRGVLYELLGSSLVWLLQPGEASDLYRQGLREAVNDDIRHRLTAGLITIVLIEPNRPDLLKFVDELEMSPSSGKLGSRVLDGVLAWVHDWCGNPAAVQHARNVINDRQLVEIDNGEPYYVGAQRALIDADCFDVITNIDDAIAQAHQSGSVMALCPAADHRGLVYLRQGKLADAEIDFTVAMRAIEAGRVDIGRPFNGTSRAKLFMAQGRLDEAQKAIEWAGAWKDGQTAMRYLMLGVQAKLLRLRQNYEEALATALEAGDCFAAYGGVNPAVLPWRSEAALCLLALGQIEEARRYTDEEVALARRWGAPRALGRALRVAGLAEAGDDGLDLLTEAATVLESSSARLEYANALIDLGAALRRAGQRRQAQVYLRHGMELAQGCGSAPLAREAMTELKITGARPRRVSLTGPKALTASEQRVAELAASGFTNHDIAQRLFITPKTVEVHLTNTYRKLGVTRRGEIQEQLSSAS